MCSQKYVLTRNVFSEVCTNQNVLTEVCTNQNVLTEVCTNQNVLTEVCTNQGTYSTKQVVLSYVHWHMGIHTCKYLTI